MSAIRAAAGTRNCSVHGRGCGIAVDYGGCLLWNSLVISTLCSFPALYPTPPLLDPALQPTALQGLPPRLSHNRAPMARDNRRSKLCQQGVTPPAGMK